MRDGRSVAGLWRQLRAWSMFDRPFRPCKPHGDDQAYTVGLFDQVGSTVALWACS